MKKIADLPDSPIYRGLPKEKFPCHHPEHNPPTHIVLSPGIYEHTCPACGKTKEVIIRPTMELSKEELERLAKATLNPSLN